MNQRQQPPPRRSKNAAYRQVFERLDEALAESTQLDNSEKIRLMRVAMFADVDALQKSGGINIPK